MLTIDNLEFISNLGWPLIKSFHMLHNKASGRSR